MQILQVVLQVILGITSLLLTLLILLHRGRGGGLSDMFGGGVTSNLGASGVAERNLNRITVILGVARSPSILTEAFERFSPCKFSRSSCRWFSASRVCC